MGGGGKPRQPPMSQRARKAPPFRDSLALTENGYESFSYARKAQEFPKKFNKELTLL